jgi:hypothetical protein
VSDEGLFSTGGVVMSTLLGVGLLVAAAVVVAWLSWNLWKNKTSTNVQAAGDKIAAFLDEMALLSSITPAYLLAKKRGDGKILDLLAQIRVVAATWDDSPTPPVAPTT